MPLPNFHAPACRDEILEQVYIMLLVIRTTGSIPDGVIGIFRDIILPGALWPWV